MGSLSAEHKNLIIAMEILTCPVSLAIPRSRSATTILVITHTIFVQSGKLARACISAKNGLGLMSWSIHVFALFGRGRKGGFKISKFMSLMHAQGQPKQYITKEIIIDSGSANTLMSCEWYTWTWTGHNCMLSVSEEVTMSSAGMEIRNEPHPINNLVCIIRKCSEWVKRFKKDITSCWDIKYGCDYT